jgi:formylglycine-generating enzyme required for sulfatase activity
MRRLLLLITLLHAVSLASAADFRQRGENGSPSRVNSFRDCRDCPEMVVIPSGRFMMGSPADQPGRDDLEGPQRLVRIRSLAVGRYHVTRGEWARFARATHRPVATGCAWSGGVPNDAAAEAQASWRSLHFAQDDSHPVVCVTWQDARDYARWLSRITGKHYRLPTEAEWEYAARAGTSTPYPWGAGSTHQYANHGAAECCGGFATGRDRWVNTSPVGSFPPNAFGLSDMLGNAAQWVEDCLSESYAGLPTNGAANIADATLHFTGDLAALNGAHACAYRVLRGGDWGTMPRWLRSTARSFAPPPGPGPALSDYRSGGVGFRVVRDLTASRR